MKRSLVSFLGAAVAASSAALAAVPELPRTSPSASVEQVVGVTTIRVDYSRPGVKGREIWGKLVPYGEVWRMGANHATNLSFSTPVFEEYTTASRKGARSTASSTWGSRWSQ